MPALACRVVDAGFSFQLVNADFSCRLVDADSSCRLVDADFSERLVDAGSSCRLVDGESEFSPSPFDELYEFARACLHRYMYSPQAPSC